MPWAFAFWAFGPENIPHHNALNFRDRTPRLEFDWVAGEARAKVSVPLCFKTIWNSVRTVRDFTVRFEKWDRLPACRRRTRRLEAYATYFLTGPWVQIDPAGILVSKPGFHGLGGGGERQILFSRNITPHWPRASGERVWQLHPAIHRHSSPSGFTALTRRVNSMLEFAKKNRPPSAEIKEQSTKTASGKAVKALRGKSSPHGSRR